MLIASFAGLLLPLLGGYLLWTNGGGSAPGLLASPEVLDEMRRIGECNKWRQRLGFALIVLGVVIQAILIALS
jgi:hypothetical protein